MMPVVNGMGQSRSTVPKQEKLEAIFNQHLNVVNVIRKNYQNEGWSFPGYVYIDATAGCGDNTEVGAPGSPKVFCKCVETFDLPHTCHLIDREPHNTSNLHNLFENNPNVKIYTGENSDVLYDVIGTLRGTPFGLIYFDPNGVPDFDYIGTICQHPALKKIDVLIRFSATAIKRVRTVFDNHTLKEYISSIPKQCWVIGEVAHKDPWQSMFALGLNQKIHGYDRYGLYPIDSSSGSVLLRRLNYTVKELSDPLPGQTTIFDFGQAVRA